MNESNIARQIKKQFLLYLLPKKLKVRKSDVTLQWLHFAKARRYIVMAV